MTKTEPRIVKYAEALKLLKNAVAEKGADYVYPQSSWIGTGCVNWYRNSEGVRVPSCIVGNALSQIASLDEIAQRTAVTATLFDLRKRTDIRFTPKATSLLRAVQLAQDGGAPWGSALKVGRYYANHNPDSDRKADAL